MKNLIILFILILGVNASLHSQVMRTFNYQGIVLDDEGLPLANELVLINVTIDEADLDYSTSATTSSLGAFTVAIEIGPDINFSSNVNYNIESTITTSAGTVSSMAPLSVVPMALFADKAAGIVGIDVIDESPENELQMLSLDGNVLTISDGNSVNLPAGGGGDNDNDPNNEIQNLFIDNGNLVLSNGGGQVAIANFGDGVDDDDADPSNEIQTLTVAGNVLTISDGNSVNLPTGGGGGDDDSDPNNEVQDLNSFENGTERVIEISLGGASTTIDINDEDADASNELQDLTFFDDILTISDGNSIDLSDLIDDNDADSSNELQELALTGNIVSITDGNSIDLSTINVDDNDADPTNELQNLTLSGNSLSIINGNTVDLSETGVSLWGNSGTDIFYTDGDVGIGISNPSVELQVVGEIKAGTSSGCTYTSLGSYSIEIDGAIRPQDDNLDALGHSTKRYTSLWASDGTINTSDRREKKNIKTIDYGLSDLMNLKPVSFKWKNGRSDKSNLGFIAQDLQTTLPEVVVDQDSYRDENGDIHYEPATRLGVKYTDIIPVTVRAIQEQQEVIQSQNERIALLEAELQLIKDLISKSK